MIKKFKASTMMEAMKMAKEFFGENAVILQSKKVKSGGIFDIVRPEMVEITATVYKSNVPDAVQRNSSKSLYTPTDVKKNRTPNTDSNSSAIRTELKDIKDTISDLSDYLRYSKMLLLPETLSFLVAEKGVDEDLASELVQKLFFLLYGEDLKDKIKIKNALQTEICRCLNINGNLDLLKDKSKMICMVGPTGMGKTTTVIKLATHPDFFGKKSVALITIDTYRVAAAAQLKTFAALAKLPLEIVYEPQDFAMAVNKFKNKDVILIDTAGRSPLNSQHLIDLKKYFAISRPDEIHLVLSVSMRADNLFDAVRNFSSLPVNRLIVSKIDETPRIGNLLNVAKKVDLPISFLTNGQSVPDDILLADRNEISNMIIN